MRIERSIRSELPCGAVYEMLTSTRFQERKCVAAGALSYHVELAATAGGTTVTIRRKLPPTDFSTRLRTILPKGVTGIETVVWGTAAADGSRSAVLRVEFPALPVTMLGTIRILPDGPTASTVVIDAAFTVHVPLLSRRFEGIAAPVVMAVIDAEQATGQAWAAGVR